MSRKTKSGKPGNTADTFQDILERRLSRRGVLRGGAALAALAVTGPVIGASAAAPAAHASVKPTVAAQGAGLTFSPVSLESTALVETRAAQLRA